MSRLSPALADAQLEAWRSMFERSGEPVEVSFRNLLTGRAVRDRVTHDIHSYPGRLLINIPSFFLATSLTKAGDVVADPFFGSGTVLLEAIIAGRNATGADANPLARLITQVKLSPLPGVKLAAAAKRLVRRFPSRPKGEVPDVVNLDYWFYPHVQRDLLILLERIRELEDDDLRRFFLVTLSSCIRDVSLADPRLSVPVRLRADQYPPGHWLFNRTRSRLKTLRHVNVKDVFTRRVDENIRRVASLASRSELGRLLGLENDARNLQNVSSGAVHLSITSPPYVGAQKYIRASSLSLTWLEFCGSRGLRLLEDKNIGREHFLKSTYSAGLQATHVEQADKLIREVYAVNPLRAHICVTYLREMRTALEEQSRILKADGHLVLVVGASTVCGRRFDTPAYLLDIAASMGLRLELHLVDSIYSRALMTKRHRTAGRIDSESVLLLRKCSTS